MASSPAGGARWVASMLTTEVADQEAQSRGDDENRPGCAPAETEEIEYADQAIQAGRQQPDSTGAIQVTARQHQTPQPKRDERHRKVAPPTNRHRVAEIDRQHHSAEREQEQPKHQARAARVA